MSVPITESFTAIDYGARLWASEDGVTAYQIRVPGKRAGTTKFCDDFLEAVRQQFDNGRSVSTEAPTLGSFKMRHRAPEVVALLDEFPGQQLYTISSHCVTNTARRHTFKYDPAIDNDVSACFQWQVAAYFGAKLWRPRDESLAVFRYDPLRPNYHDLVNLRNSGYPVDIMAERVYPFLPEFTILTPDQQTILGDGKGHYADDRAAAFVISLTEPSAASRAGWERVVGASRDARGTIYRQMLMVGKPRKDYEYGTHLTGISMQGALRALRQLREVVLEMLSKGAAK